MTSSGITRRISLDDDFMNHKSGSDILYGFMLNRATYNSEDDILYLTKSKFHRVKSALRTLLANESRSFLSTNINKLKNAGFLEEGFVRTAQNPNTPSYIFPNHAYKRYKLVNNDLLLYIVCTRNNLAVRIYTYLLDKYEWKKREREYYNFTTKELRQALGYAASTKTCDELIKINLLSLKREGIINYEEEYAYDDNGNYIPTKTLTFVAASCEQVRGSDPSEVVEIMGAIQTKGFDDEVL